MHYSGILVVVRPDRFDAGVRALAESGLAEIHHRDAISGRIIAVLESERPDGQPALLERIRALPEVIMAELVYYLCDEDRGASAGQEPKE